MTVEKSVRFYFKGLKIDSRTEEYVTKKLRTVQKLLEKINRIEVEINMNERKNTFRVEVMIKTLFQLYRAEETTESIESSIDMVCEELKVQIKKNKERIIAMRRRGGRSLKKRITIDQNARF